MKKILIVDDEQISLMMANYILATDYLTFCASSGAEAMEVFEAEKPDMVLSDLNMPIISGYDLQKKLEEKYDRSIPFMFMTADKDEDYEARGFEQGALDFIRKPFRADVLLSRVGNILNTVDKIQGLTRAAYTDPMTGLLNKTSSQEKINGICKTMPGAFMMIDLDSFKLVNDIYGHDMGDKILIRFAEILQSAVRSSDFTGRIGGDEFVAYCQHVNDESVVAKKAKYINEQLILSAKEFMGEEMSIPLGVSIGCAFAPEEGTDYKTLSLKADKALYSVKNNGKHGYQIYKADAQEDTEDEENITGLSQIFKLLDERNHTKGAYTIPMEQFRTIYRFLVRVKANYNNEIWMLLISIKGKNDSFPCPSEVSDEFGEILSTSLRQSDVVAKNNKNQYVVLLLRTTRPNIKLIVDRVRNNWSQTEYGTNFGIKYELDSIK